MVAWFQTRRRGRIHFSRECTQTRKERKLWRDVLTARVDLPNTDTKAKNFTEKILLQIEVEVLATEWTKWSLNYVIDFNSFQKLLRLCNEAIFWKRLRYINFCLKTCFLFFEQFCLKLLPSWRRFSRLMHSWHRKPVSNYTVGNNFPSKPTVEIIPRPIKTFHQLHTTVAELCPTQPQLVLLFKTFTF